MSKGLAQMSGSKPFDFLVFIGRFQPVHLGHLSVIRKGLEKARHLIILCGSSDQARSLRNPWAFVERKAMIQGALSLEENENTHILPLKDAVYNDKSWVRDVQDRVNQLVIQKTGLKARYFKIGLIGHSKDQSSYYLNLFPQWSSVEVDNYQQVSATSIREFIFDDNTHSMGIEAKTHFAQLPENVQTQMKQFVTTSTYQDIQQEHLFVKKCQKAWQDAPYVPTFVTVDAVVVQSGHVLMVKRKARPGKGLLALPGGFLNPQESLSQACIRQLKMNTRLKVPASVLQGSIKRQEVFDDPHRSARGRTISHAFYIELSPSKMLPKAKGAQQANETQWMPLAELDPKGIFEDHYFIIQKMTSI